MESKEEILNRNYYLARVVTDGRVDNTEAILKAMDEYAQQMAIEFAEYMILDKRAFMMENKWKVAGSGILKTSVELFNQFLNEKQK